MSDSFPWYEPIEQDDRLHQGEIIFSCPVARWKDMSAKEADLQLSAEYVTLDAVVMSQDCDLANGKIPSIILCPAFTLGEYKVEWELRVQALQQNPTEKMWKSQVARIAQGI